MEDNDRGIYACFAGILPPILGLGLIELYVSRDVSFGMIAACLLALGTVMVVIVALVDLSRAAARHQAKRLRRSAARR